MKSPGENPPTFEESIELNTPMTPEEATEKLATFHNAPTKNILAAFINLRNFQGSGGTVEFREGINRSKPCITMEGRKPDGSWAWNHQMDKETGQSLMRIG